MARTYTQRRRAESQAETRQRIVEAAVNLHGTVGPANTTVSMIAEEAGVQRHTVYAHFPDERSVLMACSAHSVERDPLPEAEAWRAIENARERLTGGLSAVYAWYARNEGLLGCVLRDAEAHALVQEIIALRFGPATEAWRDVLGQGLNPRQHALLRLALSFHSWRTLAREAGLGADESVAAMADAVFTRA